MRPLPFWLALGAALGGCGESFVVGAAPPSSGGSSGEAGAGATVSTSSSGAGGSAAGGGEGAAPPAPCNGPESCPPPPTPCAHAACLDGVCGSEPEAYGAMVPNQIPGDCQTAICDGNGGEASLPEDGDFPNDGEQCTIEYCSGGVPQQYNENPYSWCDQNGGTMCDGDGHCVACLNAWDCPLGDSPCAGTYCDEQHQCGYDFVAQGTTIWEPYGDCRKYVCDGAGNAQELADYGDVPGDPDPHDCKVPVCKDWGPDWKKKDDNSACGKDNKQFCCDKTCCPQGQVCDDNDKCVAAT
ncbi:MAG: hypothetical protein HY744_09655 [Deltaproteobacteria bacterium]|nr:hypothetical protein [Deltaproteobacteria bacterium]